MLILESYIAQRQNWPEEGRHVLAQYDEKSIVVYQAYKPSIGQWSVRHQRLGGPDFSYGRMSWIKPNFLWMMYRSGWGTKKDQETTLALRLARSFFDNLLETAVASAFSGSEYQSVEEWKAALQASEVRLQWDPDHDPHGKPQERRAIQLGLRGMALKRFGEEALLEILDVSDFVSEQFKNIEAGDLEKLQTPMERVYIPESGITYSSDRRR